MSFLAPLFLLGAAAAAVPIVLHLLKREPEARIKFAVVRLLRRAPVERTDRRRLRELLLLALRVTALVLLALAFARPFLTSAVAPGSEGVTVVALDTSLSMSAPGRFERAQELANGAIERAPAGHLVAVVTFADDARVVVPPSEDRGAARSAVAAATTGFGATRYRVALRRTADAIGGRRATIALVTDLQQSGWAAGDSTEIPASSRLELLDVGVPPPNLAVTAVRLAGDRLIATVRNASLEKAVSREARVRLTVDNRPAGEGAVTVAPNQSSDVILPAAKGAVASVAVDDPDGVQGDNVRYLLLEASSRPSVLIVTSTGELSREGFFVTHALNASNAGGPSYRTVGVNAPQLSTWETGRLAEHAVVVLLSTGGLERAGRTRLADYVRGGGGLLIAAGPRVDGEVVAELFLGLFKVADPSPAGGGSAGRAARTLAPADRRHPIFQAFGANVAALGLVTFDRVAAIGGAGCHTLARFTTGESALIDCAAGEGRALLFASDLERQWNDFPRHATFVPFLHESVRYLAGKRPGGADYLIGGAPPGVPPRPGIATVAVADGLPARRVAINVDPAEADPARLTPDEFQSAVSRADVAAEPAQQAENRQHEDAQRLWQYALGAMLVVLLVESFVGTRTA